MKVKEAIERSSVIYPSDMDKNRILEWVNELEARIYTELFNEPFQSITDGDTELRAPQGYEELYPLYLMMKRELACGDCERYSALASAFGDAYSEYANYVNRMRQPSGATYFKTV